MDNNIGDQLEKELKLLRSEYWKQWDSENPSPRLQLEYASLLSCSPDKANIREALDLFNELIEIGYNRPDCLYQLSIAHLKLGDHALARQQIEQLLRMEPRNLSALSLHSLILDRTSHDGLVGLGVAAALAAGCIGLFLMRRWRGADASS
eukprot:GHVS01010880.1.p1 GENE.GHVS01010880.1~~GHVS01010880.1.p1  ORF type:complete len:150 (+),score=21.19 GHVS01010880.1:176-625(+)